MGIRQTQNVGDPTNRPNVHPQWRNDAHPNLSDMNNSYPSLYGTDGSGIGPQVSQAGGSSSNDGFENIYGFSMRSVGTEPSPQNSNQDGSGSRSQSNHPTPSTASNHNSSHTSYTSPPMNQTGASNTTGSTHSQQSPGFPFSTQDSWNLAGSNQMGAGSSTNQAQNINIPSMGMTPNLDSFWPPEGMSDGNDWMFGWPGSTPQP